MAMNRPSSHSPMDMTPNGDEQPKERGFHAPAGDIDLPPPENRGETSVASMEIDQREDSVPKYIKAGRYSIDTWGEFEKKAKELLNKVWAAEVEGDMPDYSEFINHIETIPFMKKKFGNKIRCLEEKYEPIQLAADTQYTHTMVMTMLNNQSAARAAEHTAAKEICEHLGEIKCALIQVSRDLVIFSNLSQAEEGASFSRKRGLDGNPKENTAIPQHEQEHFERHIQTIPVAEIGMYFDKLKTESVKLERFSEGGRRIGAFDALTKREQDLLRKFNSSLQSAFKTATLLEKQVSEKFKDSLLSLEQQLACGSGIFPEDLLLPGPLSREIECVQPFLLSLLRSLGTAWETMKPASTGLEGANQESSKKDKPPTPHKSIKDDRNVAGTSLRHKRIADKAVAADGCFVFLHFNDSIEVTTEIKPGERASTSGSSQGPMALLKEGENQVLSHLAKHVYVGLNFLGVGVDTMATGMYLTTTHVQFTRLKLMNTGTSDAKLVLCQSSIMPILSRENFDKYVKARSEKEGSVTKASQEWGDLRSQMYGDGQPARVDSSAIASVPSGLVALFNIMTTSRADLFGPTSFESDDIDELLGTGSFASVHSAPSSENAVVKVSRCGASEWINNEAEVLSKLGMKTDAPVSINADDFCIVRLLDTSPIDIAIGGVSRELPGLQLTPRGVPASSHLVSMNTVEDKREKLKCIGTRLLATLEFMHKKGFYHMDVSVHNIMIDVQTGEPFFVDFGHASDGKRSQKGFVGTPRFAHREIFEKYPSHTWSPDSKYDKSALAFSMAALSVSEVYCPWVSFQPRTLNKNRKPEFIEWADQRSKKAWECLQESSFEEVWRVLCFDGKETKCELQSDHLPTSADLSSSSSFP